MCLHFPGTKHSTNVSKVCTVRPFIQVWKDSRFQTKCFQCVCILPLFQSGTHYLMPGWCPRGHLEHHRRRASMSQVNHIPQLVRIGKKLEISKNKLPAWDQENTCLENWFVLCHALLIHQKHRACYVYNPALAAREPLQPHHYPSQGLTLSSIVCKKKKKKFTHINNLDITGYPMESHVKFIENIIGR